MNKQELEILKNWIMTAPREEREEVFSKMTPSQMEAIKYDWDIWARPKQQLPDELFDNNSEKNTLLVCAARGFGKDYDLSVHTPTANKGMVTLRDIEIGDIVFDEQGKQCNVLKVHETNPEKAYKLTFDCGETVVCSDTHLWTTLDHRTRTSWFRTDQKQNSPYSSTTLGDDWASHSSGGRFLSKTKFDSIKTLLEKGYTTSQIVSELSVPISKVYQSKKIIDEGLEDVYEFEIPFEARTMTTQELVDTFYHSKRSDLNHSIPCVFPIQMPHQTVDLSYYTLGCWLGDGSKNGPYVCSDDFEIIDTIARKDNLKYRKSESDQGSQFGTYLFCGQDQEFDDQGKCIRNTNIFANALKSLGLIGDKHIPEIYTKGSIEQRCDLIRGLMDTDGYIDKKKGCVEFCNTNKKIIDGFFQVICGLGMKASLSEGRAMLNGVDHGPKWRICWSVRDFNPFHLSRKAQVAEIYLKKTTGQQNRNRQRMITKFEEVEVPADGMRCLEVDSPNNLFCITKSFIATHNSKMSSESIRKVMTGKTPLSAGRFSEIMLVGETDTDLKTAMITGPSGILRVHPEDFRPTYNDGDKKLTWPNGAVCHVRHDRSYDNIPGTNVQAVFSDEFAKWRYMEKTYAHIKFANRISHNGSKPIHVITTTPRPKKLLKEIMLDRRTILVKGTTHENSANLAKSFLEDIEETYGKTRIGRQELYGEFLENFEGALWNYDMIKPAPFPDLDKGNFKIVIAVDPSTKSSGDECGIVVAAKDMEDPGHYYVLEDASLQASPAKWANVVVRKYEKWSCSKIIVETNQGGDMCEEILRAVDDSLPIKKIHAYKGKRLRATPISHLYEQGKVFHCYKKTDEHSANGLENLEQEMINYTEDGTGASPNRLDALVYALAELKGKSHNSSLLESMNSFKLSGFYE